MDLDRDHVVVEPHLCEPFINGRDTGRLLHDLGAMLSLLDPALLRDPILDFGAGSCWITEAVARMGYQVTAFDIHNDLAGCIAGRVKADRRIDRDLITYASGDGHAMPFPDATFGHLLCYDTLHHMHDYDQVFREFSRVLEPGGRAIFVEPGARHSTSQQTIEFMKLKTDDPTWIERDVVLEEINACAIAAKFSGLKIVPTQHPLAPMVYTVADWQAFRKGNRRQVDEFASHMANVNYNERLVFFCERAA
jgi:SAM-dependent methyltransferase